MHIHHADAERLSSYMTCLNLRKPTARTVTLNYKLSNYNKIQGLELKNYQLQDFLKDQ